MKLLKILISLLIIFLTILLTSNLIKKLDFDFFGYLDSKYIFLFLTLFTQILGVYFSSKRWMNCVKYYAESKKIIFSFSTYFYLNSRANIINNFLPSIIIGDLSKLISPNSSKNFKKTELKYIFVDRIIGVFTLLNLGLISATYIGLLHLELYIVVVLLQIIALFIIRSIKINFFKIQSILKFIISPPPISIFTYSFLSQISFSLSLFFQILAFKSVLHLNDLFISIFLNFMGIVPFSINGWGVREWAASQISSNYLEQNNLIISSIIFGICFSLSNLLIYSYTFFNNSRKVFKN